MDKNLRDDTLKLVRYKLLFVKREHEKAFPEQEDLVYDNLDEAAFTAWKVAEFIQNHPNLVAEEDKKYLRVYYEVLQRFPREKFKYEEDQIRVLRQISDKLSTRSAAGTVRPPTVANPPITATPPQEAPQNTKPADAGQATPGGGGIPIPDPFAEIRDKLQLSKDVFDIWRANFASCADRLAPDVARILNEFRTFKHKAGGDSILKPPEITAEEVAAALKTPRSKFDRVTLDRFTGPALGDLRVYTAPDAPPEERAAPPVFSVWGPAREGPKGEWRQRITGSRSYIDPDDLPTVARLLAEEKIDLTFNAYTEDLGFVSWAVFYQNHKNQLRSIGYEMNGKLLWINQLLTPELRPLLGDVELASVGKKFIPENQFVVSVDYLEPSGATTYFDVQAMHMNFDLKKCTVAFAGPILQMKNRLEAKSV